MVTEVFVLSLILATQPVQVILAQTPVTVQVDRTTIARNEQVTLTIQTPDFVFSQTRVSLTLCFGLTIGSGNGPQLLPCAGRLPAFRASDSFTNSPCLVLPYQRVPLQ